MNILHKIGILFSRLTEVQVADPDDLRRRRLLDVLLGGVMVLTILTVLVTLYYDIKGLEPQAIFIYRAALVLLPGIIFIYLINRFWSGLFASSIFLLLLTLVLTADDPQQVVNGRTLFMFAIPILMASVLIRSYASFIMTGIVGVVITFIALKAGLVPNFVAILACFMIALVSWLSSRNLEQALRDLRIINANLDNIVTERTHALAESLAREHLEAGRNQAILSSIADGVVVFNASNYIMLVNPALSHLTEIPMQDLSGITLDEFVQTRELSPANRGIIMRLIEYPEKIEAGVRVEWGKKTLSVSIARVKDVATNENIGTAAVFRDISREAELEKMKDTFTAIVSHELRTPLNAILGHVEILKEAIYGPLNEKQSAIMERVMVNVRRLLAMVGDLLDETQMKAGKLSIQKQPVVVTSLPENLHATMDKIATDKGLYLTDEIDPNMPEVIKGDPQRLQQILINLVGNSVKFTEKGGIHICILRSDKDHWTIEVTDTGVGIPEQEILHIFETFRQVENPSTRKYGGLGLGLAIVKQLVELMNGKITVKSELYKGSTFTVTLPL
ncbi:MAG: ATP-binding protein [Anaerolineales bacterium]|nr:ATP-binding protein [Anaerolineales bacterium]